MPKLPGPPRPAQVERAGHSFQRQRLVYYGQQKSRQNFGADGESGSGKSESAAEETTKNEPAKSEPAKSETTKSDAAAAPASTKATD